MKKYVMAFVALMTAFPALFFIHYVIHDIFTLILLILLVCWAMIEFYIGFTKTFNDKLPRHRSIIIADMVWLLFMLYSWLDYRFNWTTIKVPSLLIIFMLVICSLSLLIRLWAVVHLGQSFTYDVISPKSGKFVTTGPYRIIRHPAYLGILVIASLPGLLLGSIPGFIGMVTTTIVPISIRIKMEDALLEKSFGSGYIKYKRSTSRIIPFIY